MDEETRDEQQEQEGQEQQEQPASVTSEDVAAMIAEALKKIGVNPQRNAREEAEREADRLARMSDEERKEYKLKKREDDLAERENRLLLAENKAACATILAEKGLPAQLADFVVDADADTMKRNIDQVDKIINSAVEAKVKQRLASASPRSGSGGSVESVTKESFRKMSLAEQSELYHSNPELYKSLTK